jgi:hypothetical protein
MIALSAALGKRLNASSRPTRTNRVPHHNPELVTRKIPQAINVAATI